MREPLIGKWRIKGTALKVKNNRERVFDVLTKDFIIEFKLDNTFIELNSALNNNTSGDNIGEFIIEKNVIKLYIPGFHNYIRTYILEKDRRFIRFYPQDKLYCGDYANVKYFLLEKI